MTTLITLAHTALTVILAAQPSPSPTADPLDQVIGEQQQTATGQVELATGHVDVGPRFSGGQWQLQIHDDTHVPPVWRQPEDVVLRVNDSALETVPDDPAYGFLQQPPGSKVFVVPQTQKMEVVWIGWNTQDPATMKAVARGVTMNLTGLQGPGRLIVFLQSGTLGAPQVLWDSGKPLPQPLWVETNTHTHANWVFSAPGVYLMRMTLTAELVDGRKTETTGVVRFAVGTQTHATEAFAAAYTGPEVPAVAGSPSPAPQAAPDTFNPLPIAGIAAAALALAAILLWTLARGRRARRQALTGRSGSTT